MTSKNQQNDGELSDQQLEDVAGGQDVVKMEKIVVTAKKPANFVAAAPEATPVKMETIQVTAKRERPDAAGTRLAAVDSRGKK